MARGPGQMAEAMAAMLPPMETPVRPTMAPLHSGCRRAQATSAQPSTIIPWVMRQKSRRERV